MRSPELDMTYDKDLDKSVVQITEDAKEHGFQQIQRKFFLGRIAVEKCT